MRKGDLTFANDARGAVSAQTIAGTWWLLLSVMAVIIAAISWANWAKVGQVTTATGRVIASQQTQSVESLIPGTVAEILVSEGESVTEGQGLVRIDDTSASSRLGELARKQSALRAEQQRLQAHLDGADDFQVPPGVAAEETAFYRDQIVAFNAQKTRLAELKKVREGRLAQTRNTLLEIDANIAKNENLLKLSRTELNLMRRLYARKAITQVELLKNEKETAQIEGDLTVAKASRQRLLSEIEEAKLLIGSEESEFLAKVSTRLSSLNAELAVVRETMKAARDTVTRTLLRSPVSGIVNKLNVASINEVVSAGVSVAEIVPVGDQLMIEARVRPEDIGFISPGLDATIRITAYDYTRYGTLTGKVARIGSDTITDENRETYYQVVIESVSNRTSQRSEEVSIIPGMIATVDIKSGERTVLDYLLKPVLILKDRALRDPR